MDETQRTRGASDKPIRALIAGLILAVLLVFAFSVSRAEATQYFGEKPGKWKARILVRDEKIKAVRIMVRATCRDQEHPSKIIWETGWNGAPLNLNIRRHGGFYKETRTRWSKQVFKGRLTGKRIRAHLWFADRGDYVQCWSGSGTKPGWVGFTAKELSSKRR